jgi:hypothetical protein
MTDYATVQELDAVVEAVGIFMREDLPKVRDEALRAAQQGQKDVSALVQRAEAETAALRVMIARQMGA